jgi:hypothetical protein
MLRLDTISEFTDCVEYVLSLAFECFRLLTGGWLVGCLHVSQDFWQRLFHVKIFVNASETKSRRSQCFFTTTTSKSDLLINSHLHVS